MTANKNHFHVFRGGIAAEAVAFEPGDLSPRGVDCARDAASVFRAAGWFVGLMGHLAFRIVTQT